MNPQNSLDLMFLTDLNSLKSIVFMPTNRKDFFCKTSNVRYKDNANTNNNVKILNIRNNYLSMTYSYDFLNCILKIENKCTILYVVSVRRVQNRLTNLEAKHKNRGCSSSISSTRIRELYRNVG